MLYLTRLARRLCRDSVAADDLVQDVLEKTLRSPVPEGADRRARLARVMRNRFIDQLRRDHARREELVGEPRPPRPEAAPWWHALTEDDVRAELVHLPPDQRAVFELFALEGRSYDEIAAQLGIPKNTVGTRILRARQKLRELLTARGCAG